MRTTITLDLDVAKELKKRLKESDLTFKSAINLYLREGFKRTLEKQRPSKIELPQAKKLQVKRGLSCENVWQLLEDVENS